MDYAMVDVSVETYIKAVKCECGGIYAQRVGGYIYIKTGRIDAVLLSRHVNCRQPRFSI